MNTTLKPSVPSQSSSVPNQLNKPMHPQGTPTFNQPSGHMSQNPYPNINVAHNHPNVQQNHFSLNVPNASSHFNMGTIPASNHPVPNMSQSAAGQQIFNPQKSSSYSSSYQPNLGHPPNPNTIPPVSQTLPATSQIQSQQPQSISSPQKTSVSPTITTSTPDAPPPEKPQSNGTSELKTPTKLEEQSNHVLPPSTLSSQITQGSTVPAQQTEKFPEKAKTQLIEEQKPPPSEPGKLVVENPILLTRAAPVTNNEKDQTTVESKVSKPVEIEVKPQENKDMESKETSSVSLMETDPLATDKDESSTTEQSTSSMENIENQASATGKNQEESSECSQENMTNETDQEAESTDHSLTSKSSEPETPTKTTLSRAVRKSKTPKSEPIKPSKPEPKTPVQKSPSTGKIKRQRTRTQHYQSPLPEIEIVTKMSSSTPKNKNTDDKLIYFYKNEFLAVRNAEGGFYLCQAIQNIYKSSLKIKIRWLSQDKNDKTGEIYTPDFYDLTDFDCILTSLDLDRVDKGKYRLTKAEKERTDSILKRCLAVEKGEITSPNVSEEHPDGLDLSLYKDEEQLKKRKGIKRKSSSSNKKQESATKKSPDTPKVQKVDVSSPKKTPVAKKPAQKKAVPAESKRVATPSRAAKGKRKSDTKTSPVVDLKKAKVLARIGRKTAIPASTKPSQPSSKSVKPAKSIPSTSKAPVKPPANSKASTSTRNTKRSTRK